MFMLVYVATFRQTSQCCGVCRVLSAPGGTGFWEWLQLPPPAGLPQTSPCSSIRPFPHYRTISRLKLNIFYLLRCPNSRHGTVSHSTLTHQWSEFHSKSPMSSKLITFLSSLYVDSNVKQVQNNSTHQKKEKKKAKHRS